VLIDIHWRSLKTAADDDDDDDDYKESSDPSNFEVAQARVSQRIPSLPSKLIRPGCIAIRASLSTTAQEICCNFESDLWKHEFHMDSNPPQACRGAIRTRAINLKQAPGERDDVLFISRHPRLRCLASEVVEELYHQPSVCSPEKQLVRFVARQLLELPNIQTPHGEA